METPSTPAPAAAAVTPPPAADTAPAAAPATDAAKPADPAPAKTADDTPLLFDDKLKGDEPPADDPNAVKKEGDDTEKKEGDDANKPEPIKFEEFKIDENLVVDEATQSGLMEIVNNDKLSKSEMVQALIDLHSKQVLGQVQQFNEYRQQQRESVKNDPILGGENLKKTVMAADNAIRKFAKDPAFGGSDELFTGIQQSLTVLGLGDNKHMIQFLVNVSKAIGNDSFATGQSGGSGEKSLENILFPNMKA